MQLESQKCATFVYYTNIFINVAELILDGVFALAGNEIKNERKPNEKKKLLLKLVAVTATMIQPLKSLKYNFFGHDVTDLSKYLLKTSVLYPHIFFIS